MTVLGPSWKILPRGRVRRSLGRAVLDARQVFTNGVFDLLHPGHVDLLVAARALGDCLVVGVNSDASVLRLRGVAPVRPERDRLHMLAALEAVDAVVLFDEDTPLELIRILQPNVLVKGGDYDAASIVGASEVTARGGEVVIVPLTPGYSTTSTLAHIRGLVL